MKRGIEFWVQVMRMYGMHVKVVMLEALKIQLSYVGVLAKFGEGYVDVEADHEGSEACSYTAS